MAGESVIYLIPGYRSPAGDNPVDHNRLRERNVCFSERIVCPAARKPLGFVQYFKRVRGAGEQYRQGVAVTAEPSAGCFLIPCCRRRALAQETFMQLKDLTLFRQQAYVD